MKMFNSLSYLALNMATCSRLRNGPYEIDKIGLKTSQTLDTYQERK